MSEHNIFIQSAHLHLQANNLFLSTFPLQRQIFDCNNELATLLGSANSTLHKDRIRDLKDEIFGCKIELQVIQLRASRLVKQSQYVRFAQDF